MEWVTKHADILTHIAVLVLGYIAAMFTNYIKFGRDIAFIKGQLESILRLNHSMKDLQEKHDIMERDIIQNIREIEKTCGRLTIIETYLFKKEFTL